MRGGEGVNTGPYKPKLEVKGPYSEPKLYDVPDAWYYLENEHVEIHLQAMGPDGLMHYIVKVKNA